MKEFRLLSILICVVWPGLSAQTPAVAANSRTAVHSCSLLHPPAYQGKSLNDVSLLNAYNAQASLIRSLQAFTMVRGQAGKEYRINAKQAREIPAIIDFEKPDFIRIKGVIPFVSNRGFEMTSDGQEFRLLVPDHGKTELLVGPVGAAAQSADPRENLRPQPLIDALWWQEGKLRKVAHAQSAASTDRRTLEIDVPSARGGARTVKVEFDFRSGVVDSLSTYDQGGQLVSEAKYEDWKEAPISATGQSEGCFPRRIHLSQPRANYELDIKILQLSLNPDIPKSNFRLYPPRGISVVHLDMAGGRSDR